MAGQRGFAIFSDTGETPTRVVLQHRAVDADIDVPLISTPQSISWVSDMVIQYCPFCGKHLESWYSSQLEKFKGSSLAIRLRYE